MRNISFWITQQSNCFFNYVSLPLAVAGIIHTTPLSVLAGISSHGKNHWISSPVKLWDLRRDTSSHKVAVFVGLILHWEKVGGGTHQDASFAQSHYSPYSYLHPLGIWLLALGHLASPGVPQGYAAAIHPQDCWQGRLQSCLADQGSISCLCLCAARATVSCFQLTLHSFFSCGAKLVEFPKFVSH